MTASHGTADTSGIDLADSIAKCATSATRRYRAIRRGSSSSSLGPRSPPLRAGFRPGIPRIQRWLGMRCAHRPGELGTAPMPPFVPVLQCSLPRGAGRPPARRTEVRACRGYDKSQTSTMVHGLRHLAETGRVPGGRLRPRSGGRRRARDIGSGGAAEPVRHRPMSHDRCAAPRIARPGRHTGKPRSDRADGDRNQDTDQVVIDSRDSPRRPDPDPMDPPARRPGGFRPANPRRPIDPFRNTPVRPSPLRASRLPASRLPRPPSADRRRGGRGRARPGRPSPGRRRASPDRSRPARRARAGPRSPG